MRQCLNGYLHFYPSFETAQQYQNSVNTLRNIQNDTQMIEYDYALGKSENMQICGGAVHVCLYVSCLRNIKTYQYTFICVSVHYFLKHVISNVISSQCVYTSAFIPQADNRNASFNKESMVQGA